LAGDDRAAWGADHYLQHDNFDVAALLLRLLDKQAAGGEARSCYAASGNEI
jgi:hypothetical protein